MPRATVGRDTVRHDLRTCSGGWVELRQLSYDEMLERRDGGSKIVMEQYGVRRNSDASRMAVQLANKWSNHFTFPRCIVSHNLEDESGTLLDFSKPELVFKTLDPKVGAEIEQLIDALNQEADEDEDFTTAQDSSSANGEMPPSDSTVQN
jgi:hypothetical protein